MKEVIERWISEDQIDWNSKNSPESLLMRVKRIAELCVSVVDIVQRAKLFATLAHNGQFRKFEKIPYIVHPERVANKVISLPNSTPEMVAAAYLHDTEEDCGATDEVIRSLFGGEVADIVLDLTNRFKDAKDSNGKLLPRAKRKALEFERVKTIKTESKRIKMIDRIDNLSDMKKNPQWDFVVVYAKEGSQLIESVGHADEALKSELSSVIDSILGENNGSGSCSR